MGNLYFLSRTLFLDPFVPIKLGLAGFNDSSHNYFTLHEHSS